MIKTRQLFVIDQNRETGEVLKAVLGKQRTEVTAVRNWRQLHHLGPAEKNTVLVVNSGNSAETPPEAQHYEHLPRVVIGRLRLDDACSTSPLPLTENAADFHSRDCSQNSPKSSAELHAAMMTADTTECCLGEIFEYPDLIDAIEKLWRHTA